MKATKKIVAALMALCLLLSFAACSGTSTDETTTAATTEETTLAATGVTVNAAVLKGPTGMGMAWLMNENESGTSANTYNFTVAGSADEITSQLVAGTLDIAAIPTNAASVLYNKTKGGVTVLAVNTLGVLYVIEKGNTVQSIADLKGKKIVSAGQGTTAEYVVNYVLSKNNLTVGEDVTIDYVSEHTEAASLALSGEYDIAIVPEPFVTNITAKDSDFHICIDLTAAWNDTGAGELVMGAIAARTAFVKENPEAVKAFMAEYKKSIEFTNSSVEQAAQLIEKYGITTAAVAQSAIPNSHIVFIDGSEMKDKMSAFLQVIYDMEPTSIGGAMPADDFYYTA